MVGSAFYKSSRHMEFIFVESKECDLSDYDQTISLFAFHRPDIVIHLAAKVGGLIANMENMGEFYLKNIQINTNVLEAAKQFHVAKVVSLLSTCVYPAEASYPLTEDQIHSGPPHESNFAYAYAKRMLDIQSRAYRKQYGCNFITAVPNNLYGKHDNFDLENSHVIPAMIRKIYMAREDKRDVVLWGSGSPVREFTYAQDLVDIVLFLVDHYSDPEPINVGNTKEYSIKSLAEIIAKKLNFKGNIIWDTEKPDGQKRKPSDNSKLISLGWREENYTSLEQGLDSTIEWFESIYPMVRGL